MGFQILLEGQRFMLVGKSAVPDELPRFEFGGMCGFAGVVFGQSSFQVRCGANVILVRIVKAADDVDVPSVLTRLAERALGYLGECLATRSPLREC